MKKKYEAHIYIAAKEFDTVLALQLDKPVRLSVHMIGMLQMIKKRYTEWRKHILQCLDI